MSDPTPAPAAPALLHLEGLTKAFGTVQALDDVSLDFRSGEVLALVGENGAGKSTLLRTLSGDHQPDAGRILLDGSEVRFPSPRDARAAGIRVIYQEPEILPALSVAENLYLGELPRSRAHFVRWRELVRASRALIEDFDPEGAVGLRPEMLARNLSPAQRQVVEIIRALKGGARLLALDEPTSSLNEVEAERLFAQVERLRAAGVAIVYVSHRLREVTALADRTAVLRDGKLVALTVRGESSEAEMIRQMVGRPLGTLFTRGSRPPGDVVLRAEGLGTDYLRDISLELRAGEIVGVAGLVGAGRTELAKTLFGDRRVVTGTLTVAGKPVTFGAPHDAIRAGIGFAPEDRKGEALFLRRSVAENTSIAILDRLRRLRFVRRRKEQAVVRGLVERLDVRPPSLTRPVGQYSGGNQQKVVLARWLASEPRVLLLDEPTRGIDVGAKAAIYALVRRLADEGMAVLFISSELPEVLGVSDRIVVMADGRIVGAVAAAEATEEGLLSMAIDHHLERGTPMIGATA